MKKIIQLFDIAKSHASTPERAVDFGVILFTDAHPNVRKVIEDNACCKALNKISGSKWTIFAARAIQGWSKMPEYPPGTFGFMYLRWHEPRENQELINVLGLDSTKDIPCLIMLFPDSKKQDEYLTCSEKLLDTSIDAAYESIRVVVSSVTEAIENVLPEILHNHEGVHAAVALKLEADRRWKFVTQQLPSFIRWVAKFHSQK